MPSHNTNEFNISDLGNLDLGDLNIRDIIDPSELFAGFWESMPPELFDNISFILNLGKYLIILFLIYVIFLIIRQLLKMMQGKRLKVIVKNVVEINKKLDYIVDNIQLINLRREKHKDKKSKKKRIRG